MVGRIAPLARQIDELTLYLRVLRANVRRASKESDSSFGKHMRRPLMWRLHSRRYRDAQDLLKIGEACLHDLLKVRANTLAPFRAGDQVLDTWLGYDDVTRESRLAIWSIEPDRKHGYAYNMLELTKRGALSKRGYLHLVVPDARHHLVPCTLPLDQETAETLEWRREKAQALMENALNVGDLEPYAIEDHYGQRKVKARD